MLKAVHLRKVFLAPQRPLSLRVARLLKPFIGPLSNSNMPGPPEYLPVPTPLKKAYGITSAPEFFQAREKTHRNKVQKH